MAIVAVYNMKGGVGKTTTAVNLSYLAAAHGKRTLLWDLDPQGASTFAFRVRPHVEGFGRKSLEGDETLAAAIKATDYDNLDLLPADFAYRKMDRLLGDAGNAARIVTSLLETLGGGYDLMFLDCPAGFSLLTEGIFAAASVLLVPTIPAALSLRTIERMVKRAERAGSQAELAVFFNMVDRRKARHRRACAWSLDHPEIFLSAPIPYASIVEQMGLRRMPLPAFASREAATAAFAGLWTAFECRLQQRRQPPAWTARLQEIEALIARMESLDAVNEPVHDGPNTTRAAAQAVVHIFDTERRDLQRSGQALELSEEDGHLLVVAGPAVDAAGTSERTKVQIDSAWALEILSGAMSPLTALDRRLGRPGPEAVEAVRAAIDNQPLQRIHSRAAQDLPSSVQHDDRVIPFHSHKASPRPVSQSDSALHGRVRGS